MYVLYTYMVGPFETILFLFRIVIRGIVFVLLGTTFSLVFLLLQNIGLNLFLHTL